MSFRNIEWCLPNVILMTGLILCTQHNNMFYGQIFFAPAHATSSYFPICVPAPADFLLICHLSLNTCEELFTIFSCSQYPPQVIRCLSEVIHLKLESPSQRPRPFLLPLLGKPSRTKSSVLMNIVKKEEGGSNLCIVIYFADLV